MTSEPPQRRGAAARSSSNEGGQDGYRPEGGCTSWEPGCNTEMTHCGPGVWCDSRAAWSGCEETAEAVVRSYSTTSRTTWTLNSSEYCDAGVVSVLSTHGRKSSPVRQAPRTHPEALASYGSVVMTASWWTGKFTDRAMKQYSAARSCSAAARSGSLPGAMVTAG